jgi:hypothetical protein
MARHSLVSSIVNTQSYTKIPRTVRLQANGLILFPSNNGEVKLLVDDVCPPHCSKRDFMKVVDYATKGKHDFLFVNNFSEDRYRFRKNFEQYVRLPQK